MLVEQIRIITLFLSAFLSLFFVFLLWYKMRGDKVRLYLGLVALFSGLYALSNGFNIAFWDVVSLNFKLILFRLTWIGILILPFFVIFTQYFIENFKWLKIKIFFLCSVGLAIVLLALFTSFFIESIEPGYSYWEIDETSGVWGPLQPLGRFYILFCLIWGLFDLSRYYFKTSGFRKTQIRYFLSGTIIYAVGGIIVAGIIPLLFKTIAYMDFSVYFSVIWIGLSTYAVLTKRLFKIKVILTDFAVGAMAILLFFLSLIIETTLPIKILLFSVFFVFCFLSYFLINYTHREAEQKEILEEKVKEKTKELRGRVEDLEKFHRLTVGRELKMVELKKEIQKLEEKLKEK